MAEKSIQHRATTGDSTPGIEKPAGRKLEVRRETLKDLAPEPGDAGKVKGGVPHQTRVIDRDICKFSAPIDDRQNGNVGGVMTEKSIQHRARRGTGVQASNNLPSESLRCARKL